MDSIVASPKRRFKSALNEYDLNKSASMVFNAYNSNAD
jgi:hypothetical protein